MKRTIQPVYRTLLMLGSTLCLGAQAAPEIYSFTNIQTIPKNDQVRCPTREGGLTLMPNMGAVLQQQMSEAQKQLQERLKEMSPTDPGYSILKGMLDNLAKQPGEVVSQPRPALEPEQLAGSQQEVNLDQAIGMLQAALEGSLSPEAFTVLKSMPEYQSAQRAISAVPLALANGKPLAAMALLLRAHELEPQNPSHLVNLAGLANFYGFWYESLALLDAAKTRQDAAPAPWSLNKQALLLNNQGHALLGINKPAQAEVVLREAVKLEPLLPEAKRNLAQALGEQGKCEEAARWYRLGAYREPIKDMVGPDKGPVESEEADAITLKPWQEAYALDRGVEGRFPHIPIPANTKTATLALNYVSTEMGRAAQGASTFSQKYLEMFPKIQAKANAMLKDPRTRMTGEVSLHLLGPINSADPEDPKLDALYEKVDEAFVEYGKARESADNIYFKQAQSSAEIYAAQQISCGTNGACQERARIEHEQRMCSAGQNWNSVLVGNVQKYDMAYRTFYRPFHKIMSGLTGEFSDPEFFEAAKTQTRALYFQHYNSYLSLVGMHVFTAGNYGSMCKDEVPPPDLEAEDPEDPEICEKPKRKPKASAGIIEVTYTCEAVEVEVGSDGKWPLFGQVTYEFSQRYKKLKDPKERFIEAQAGRNPDAVLQLKQYGYAFDGKVTVFAGAKIAVPAELGPIEMDIGAKGGLYMTVDGNYDINDAGAKIDIAHSAMVGGAVKVGYEQTLHEGSISLISGK
ncbi:hypothetical protein [Deinococcus cellulosilyticus]|uniref:Uncharacterized protein n=1 Tax=Deinococcus cellulosilyticus (strain DSM 18568 / NBRC 106333 / KACC 11606 / 5516J-15) TaxID=1223518 RepID=A0A511MVR1_DEIC1|nr:hypothetical protein [Deinococcus cellulosilyticus]GEM44662.1 hypothetical protein DC3_02970 [Deinococcus cellulosilyticus NBRC 106333 = KACC 11606]